ncbi:hypothetical protein DOY81_012195, partial [Sarcophaga bullata]
LGEVSTGDSSPLPDKNNDDDTSTIDNDDCNDDVTIPNKIIDAVVGDSDAKVLTLAEHIIAAMPERIKNEADEMMVLGSPMTETLNTESAGLNDSFMDPLLDSLPSAHFDNEFNFDFNDHNYRYHEVSTPCSSLSPASSGPLQSPASYSILGHDPSVSSPSPPPSTKQLTEFLHASSNSQYPFEADFSIDFNWSIPNNENCTRLPSVYKKPIAPIRADKSSKNKIKNAQLLLLYKTITDAINNSLLSSNDKRCFKSQTSNNLTGLAVHLASIIPTVRIAPILSVCRAFSIISTSRRNNDSSPQSCATPKETSPSGPLKRTYSQSTQNQAARKIQQFMRQSRIKLQKERAEKEKLVHQRRAEYLQNLQYQGQPQTVCPIEKSDTTNLKDSNELVNCDIETNNNHD